MKYLILIHGNPNSRAAWEKLTTPQREAGLAAYAALREDLSASGEMIVSEVLADPTLGKVVSIVDGQRMTTDGPFAESKEFLAGFFLVDCASLDRAIEHASRIPEAAFGLVEVRPVMSLGDFEV